LQPEASKLIQFCSVVDVTFRRALKRAPGQQFSCWIPSLSIQRKTAYAYRN